MLPILIFVLGAACMSFGLRQGPPDVLEMYNSAPPIVQAALRNVGFDPKGKFIQSTEVRIPFQNAAPTNSKIVIQPLARAAVQQHVPAPATARFAPRPINDNIRRGESPLVVIKPLTISSGRNTHTKNGRIVLALPNDSIQILTADSMGDIGRATNIVASSVALRDQREDDWRHHNSRNPNNRFPLKFGKNPQFNDNRPSNNRNKYIRYQYNVVPFHTEGNRNGDDDSTEEIHYLEQETAPEKPISFGSYDDIMQSGGHVTVIKAQKSQMPKILKAQSASGRSVEAMKAILIEPKEINAKRFTYVKSDARKVTPMKATLVKAGQISATKTMSEQVKVKGASYAKAKTHRNDRPHMMSSSNVHTIKAEPQAIDEAQLLGDMGIASAPDAASTDQENQIPPIDLQCGGNNDLGWCDLGPHYPISEVSQIIEICEELVNRMYVEAPSDQDDLEDLMVYSLSHNITDHFARRWDSPNWKWDSKPSPYKGTLCNVEKSFIRPSFAQDVKGKWHVIIQTEKFPQKVLLEVCRTLGEPCNQSEICNKQSQCVQKYTYHHLISFDPESAETCPFTRLYKFPTSCVCRTQSTIH